MKNSKKERPLVSTKLGEGNSRADVHLLSNWLNLNTGGKVMSTYLGIHLSRVSMVRVR